MPLDLHPSALRVQKYPLFLNECETLYRTTKTVYVREGVMNMVLSKHRPRAEGIRGQLTEFHSERKRIQNFGLRR
jgi:hypothetical protein